MKKLNGSIIIFISFLIIFIGLFSLMLFPFYFEDISAKDPNCVYKDLIDYLEKNNIPYTTFKKSQLTKNELDERMKENSIKVLTIHTAKGLEADNVIVYGSQWKTAEEIRVNYVAATRAKNLLIWMNKVNRINKMESWE